MKFFPENRRAWLAFFLFPFKAYVVIAPMLIIISYHLRMLRHAGPTEMEGYIALGLFGCTVFLFVAALLLAIFGPKGFAWKCFWFGLAGVVMMGTILPYLAQARAMS